MKRSLYETVRHGTFRDMDKALKIVGGRFYLAAKLLDMEPKRFRALVNYNQPLKAKWGRKKIGHPPGRIALQITPYQDDDARHVHYGGADLVKRLFARLKESQQKEVEEWLAQRARVAGVSEVPSENVAVRSQAPALEAVGA